MLSSISFRKVRNREWGTVVLQPPEGKWHGLASLFGSYYIIIFTVNSLHPTCCLTDTIKLCLRSKETCFSAWWLSTAHKWYKMSPHHFIELTFYRNLLTASFMVTSEKINCDQSPTGHLCQISRNSLKVRIGGKKLDGSYGCGCVIAVQSASR